MKNVKVIMTVITLVILGVIGLKSNAEARAPARTIAMLETAYMDITHENGSKERKFTNGGLPTFLFIENREKEAFVAIVYLDSQIINKPDAMWRGTKFMEHNGVYIYNTRDEMYAHNNVFNLFFMRHGSNSGSINIVTGNGAAITFHGKLEHITEAQMRMLASKAFPN